MATLKNILTLALAAKHKQQHRIVGGTKAARQLQASHSEKYVIPTENTDARDFRRNTQRIISKRDI